MAKFLKYLLLTVISLVVLAIIGIGILVYTVNPNDLKGPITRQVKAKTGRDIAINGAISWKFFPSLGFNIHNVTLSNPAGFTQNSNFLSLADADASIRLLPLFSGSIQFGTIKLDGLQLNLITNAQGQNNWDSLQPSQSARINSTTSTASNAPATKAAAAPPAVSQKFGLENLQISSIDISDAAVNYDNQKTGKKYVLKNFNFQSENISLNSPFPIGLNFNFGSTGPNLNGQVNLSAQIKLDKTRQVITLTPFQIAATINGTRFPKQGLTLNLKTALTLNKSANTLNVSDLQGQIANMHFNGIIDGVDIFNNPTLNVTFNIKSFNPTTFMQNLGLTAPKFADSNAFANASLQSRFVMTPKAVSFNSLNLTLDNSTLKGNAYLALSDKNQSQFNLNLNKIDFADYVPQATATPAGANSSTAVTASVSNADALANNPASSILPIQQLRLLNLTGKLTIGTLDYNKFSMANVILNISANNGLIQLAPNSGNLYQGQWLSNIGINVQSDAPVWQINEALNNVQIQPLIAAFYQNKNLQITGTGNIKTSLTTTGNYAADLTQNLNGSGQFALTNGTVNGINLGYQVNRALAMVNKQAEPAQPANNQTPFGSLTGTVQIKNGMATNNDLLLKSPMLTATGNGHIDFVNQQLNFKLNTSVVQNQVPQQVYDMQQKIGGSFPLEMSGSLASFKVYPDIETILKNFATAFVKQQTGQVQQNVDSQVQNVGKQLKNQLQNFFKQ